MTKKNIKPVRVQNVSFYCVFNTIFLHAQLELSFHDIFNNTFRQGFAAGELINLGNHLAIGSPLVFQVLSLAIVNVMGFGNPV